jgi:aryl-alcohol dehydrogenase-like predicted oxidoreductase
LEVRRSKFARRSTSGRRHATFRARVRGLDALLEVARELGKSPAEVALAWIARRPGVTSTLIGATKLEQLDSNLRALALEIPEALSEKLESASRPEPAHPYTFFQPAMQGMIRGGTTIRAEQPWFRPRA